MIKQKEILHSMSKWLRINSAFDEHLEISTFCQVMKSKICCRVSTITALVLFKKLDDWVKEEQSFFYYFIFKTIYIIIQKSQTAFEDLFGRAKMLSRTISKIRFDE